MKRFAFVLALIAVPAVAQTTGTWSGAYAYSIQVSSCSNKTFTANGNATLVLLQTSAAISGRLDLTNFLSLSNSCTAGTVEATAAVVGTISGGTLAFVDPTSPGDSPFTATVSGSTMNVQWADSSGGSGTMTLTRSSGDAPAVDTTGTWSGNYNFVDQCSNGVKLSYSGPMTVALTQTGGNAGGVMTMQNVPLYDQNCSKIATLTQSMAVAGSVSGATLSGAVFDPSGLFDFPVTATVSGAAMSGSVSGANSTNTTGTFTLTQSSSSVPPAGFTGTYEGTYSELDNTSLQCFNIGSFSYSGAGSLVVQQSGSDATGWLVFHDSLSARSDGFGNCVVVSVGDVVMPVYGTIANGALKVTVPFGGLSVAEVLTFSGDSVSVQLQDSAGDVAQMTATRTAVPRTKRRSVRP
ncbi:MAG TPA: hypothetical protein VLU46_09575 [Thermoanaerobaculia bacterium]|nr:hypothetical protein [Thermoanaerobaculia bacterium]